MHNRCGQSTVELIGGLLVLVPIVLFGVDTATMFMGAQMNAGMCRDACRAAASGPPAPSPLSGPVTASDPPKKRALQVLRRSQLTKGAIQIRTGDFDVLVSQNVKSMPIAQFGGLVNGSVTVQTTSDVYPPFLMARLLGKSAFTVQNSQTFPFTYVAQPTFALAPGQTTSNGGSNQNNPPASGGNTGGNTGGGFSPMSRLGP